MTRYREILRLHAMGLSYDHELVSVKVSMTQITRSFECVPLSYFPCSSFFYMYASSGI